MLYMPETSEECWPVTRT